MLDKRNQNDTESTPLQVFFFCIHIDISGISVYKFKYGYFSQLYLTQWRFQIVSSIIKPRYLTLVFDSIRFPSQITFNFSVI